MAGAAPFGILWLFYDHERVSQSIELMNTTAANLTINDTLLAESSPSLEPHPYTYPIMVILLMMGVFSATSNTTLLDATAIAMSKKHGADFARQKLWGIFTLENFRHSRIRNVHLQTWYVLGFAAMVLSPIMCGVLVEHISHYLGIFTNLSSKSCTEQFSIFFISGYEDDFAAFAVGAVATVIAVPLLAQLDVEVGKNKRSFVATIKYVMKMTDFTVFVLVEIVAGMCYAFHSIYRPVFATELHASKTLIGRAVFTRTIASLTSRIIIFLSPLS